MTAVRGRTLAIIVITMSDGALIIFDSTRSLNCRSVAVSSSLTMAFAIPSVLNAPCHHELFFAYVITEDPSSWVVAYFETRHEHIFYVS